MSIKLKVNKDNLSEEEYKQLIDLVDKSNRKDSPFDIREGDGCST